MGIATDPWTSGKLSALEGSRQPPRAGVEGVLGNIAADFEHSKFNTIAPWRSRESAKNQQP
jgi:hypothetical protein